MDRLYGAGLDMDDTNYRGIFEWHCKKDPRLQEVSIEIRKDGPEHKLIWEITGEAFFKIRDLNIETTLVVTERGRRKKAVLNLVYKKLVLKYHHLAMWEVQERLGRDIV